MRSTAKLSPSMLATFLPPFCLLCATSVPPIAYFERWLWRPLCLHSATMATLEHPCRGFCLLSASFTRLVVPPHPVFKQVFFSRETQRSQEQLHRNKTLWVQATVERPGHIFVLGRSKVARRSRPCVKVFFTYFNEINKCSFDFLNQFNY